MKKRCVKHKLSVADGKIFIKIIMGANLIKFTTRYHSHQAIITARIANCRRNILILKLSITLIMNINKLGETVYLCHTFLNKLFEKK